MTSQLNHPNTITIYDYGRTPEGVFYYAMEYPRRLVAANPGRASSVRSPTGA